MRIMNSFMKNIMSLGIATMVLSQACSPLIVRGTEFDQAKVVSEGAIVVEDENSNSTDLGQVDKGENNEPAIEEPTVDQPVVDQPEQSTEVPVYGGEDKGKPGKPVRPVKPNKPQLVIVQKEEVPVYDPELATQQVGVPQRIKLELPEVIEEADNSEGKTQVLLASEERAVPVKKETQEGILVKTQENNSQQLIVYDSNEGTTQITTNNIIAQNKDTKKNTYNILYKEDNKIKQIQVNVKEETNSQVEKVDKNEAFTQELQKKEDNKTVVVPEKVFVIHEEVKEDENVVDTKSLVKYELEHSNTKESALSGANELILTGLTFTLAGSYLMAPSIKKRK